jgi:organic hydroperoxide reductase OsmC/OhrA
VSEIKRFQVTAGWDAAAKNGTLDTPDGSLRIVHAGAAGLGGKAGAPNPEELLVSAVSACYVQTWAIFLGKLQVPITKPMVEGECAVETDPGGGFRVTTMVLHPHVPRDLWESRRAEIEKTLSLAEKYCIVSKAVKASLSLTVKPKVG